MGRYEDPRQKRRPAAPPASRGVGRRWAIGALGAGALAAGGGWYLRSPGRTARAGNHPNPAPGEPLPVTLSPVLFTGKAAAAYRAAREVPETLARIYCYCRCDQSVGHKSLLSCFSDDHAAG